MRSPSSPTPPCVRIKRLTDLGFSLSQITAMGGADEHPEQALRTLMMVQTHRLLHTRPGRGQA